MFWVETHFQEQGEKILAEQLWIDIPHVTSELFLDVGKQRPGLMLLADFAANRGPQVSMGFGRQARPTRDQFTLLTRFPAAQQQ